MNITIQIPPKCEIEVLAILQRYITTTPATAEVASPATTEQAVSLEALRQALTQISQVGKSAQVKALLAEFGAKNVKELKPQDYSAVLEKASAL